MAGPLEAGWLEIPSLSATETLECTLEMRAQVGRGSGPQPPTPGTGAQARWGDGSLGLYFATRAAAGATALGCSGMHSGTVGSVDSYSTVEMLLYATAYGPSPAQEVVLASGAGSCAPSYLGPVTLRLTYGPLRLGVSIIDGVLHYAWFEDASTVETWSVAGVIYRQLPRGDPARRTRYTFNPNPSGLQSSLITGQGFMAQFAAIQQATLTPGLFGESTFTHSRFAAFTANNGSGAAAVTAPRTTEYKLLWDQFSGFDPGGGERFGWPWGFRCDVDCDETSGSAVTADFDLEGDRTCPAVFDVSKRFWSTTNTVGTDFYSNSEEGYPLTPAVIDTTWATGQTVQPYVADRTFRFEGNDPKTPAGAARTDWSVGSLTIASPVNVLLSSTAWAVDLGTVSIGGTPTVPVFTVTSGPVIVRRPLSESWRDWNTPASPDYQPEDNFTTTKHNRYVSGAADDAWGWGLYAYLDVDMTVPAGPNTELAVEVTWAVVRHLGTIDTIVVNYSPLTFPAGGRSTQRADLLFPVEIDSRPFHGERVDQVRLVGLQNGVTTLHSLSLVADQQAYLGVGGRKATLIDGTVVYTGVVLAQDGAAPSLLWGRDTAQSGFGLPQADRDGDGWIDFRGDHENGTFTLSGTTKEILGKAPGMLQGLIADTFVELNRMEGLTATYSAAAINAAFTDGTNTIGLTRSSGVLSASPVVRTSDWLKPLLPHARITKNVAYDLRAQLVVSGVVICPGVTASSLRIFQRNHLGLTLEAVATDANYFRQGSGVTVRARGYTGGAPTPSDTLLQTATTDASGYVVLPIRNGTIGGAEFNAYTTGS